MDRTSKRQFVPILMYHSVSTHVQPKFAKFVISPDAFARHMAYLSERGFTTMTVTQYAHALPHIGATLPAHPVILTFDDGYADFHSNALPILRRYGMVATIYVATAYVGRTSEWLYREGESMRPMLSWAQLQEIRTSGVECGAHTHTHPPLDIISPSDARKEILLPKLILEERLGEQIASFAYPYGYYTLTLEAMVKEAGYASACAVRYRLSSLCDDPYALPRLLVTPNMDIRAFAALLAGQQPWAASLMKRARSRMWRSARISARAVFHREHAPERAHA